MSSDSQLTLVTHDCARAAREVLSGGHRIRLLVAALACAGLAGLAAGPAPTLVIGGVIAIAVAGIVVVNITVGLMMFVLAAGLETLPTLPGLPTPAKVLGLLLVLGWLLGLAMDRDQSLRSDFFTFAPGLVVLLVLFLSWLVLSLLWAADIAVARATFVRLALNVLLFPIVFAALRSGRDVVWLCCMFVFGGLLSASVGVATGTSDVGGRLGGAGVNPDNLAAILGTAAVIAFGIACVETFNAALRVLALLGAALCLFSLLLTQARGALVGVAMAMILAPFLAGHGRRLKTAAVVLVCAGFFAVWLMAFTPATTMDRLSNFHGGSGRSDLWTIALRIAEDKPITGVGAGNFPVVSVHYLLRPGAIVKNVYIVDKPLETHNIFLQLLAEVGVVGLGLYLAIIVACLSCGIRAAALFRIRGAVPQEVLSRAIVLALIVLLVSSAFTTALYGKQLYILLATCPALLGIARSDRYFRDETL